MTGSASNHGSLGLGIDAGGTATRWRLADAKARPVADGLCEPVSGHIFSPEAEDRARRIVEGMARDVRRTARPAGIVAGITGLTREAPVEAFLKSLFAAAFEVPESRVLITEDMWIAYLSHFAPGEGIVVYSGTGSIGYYLSPTQEAVQIGGRGNLIDDGGSGFWIAREALKAVLRLDEELPGSGWGTPLGKALAEAIGGDTWNDVRTFVYGGDRGTIGTLARTVAEAATAGDERALSILAAAGGELARLANSLILRVGSHPVALMGGASRAHPAVLEAFRAAIPATCDVITTRVDAALTAARLAAALP